MLGYRQRAIMALLTERGHPLPFGFICRQMTHDIDSVKHTTACALQSLRARVLVRQSRYGYWEAV